MDFLARWRDRLFGADSPTEPRSVAAGHEMTETDSPSPAHKERGLGGEGFPTDDATVLARQERAAERILDDEGLRGDLADDEFQPLLDWALMAADRIAAGTAGLSDDEADQRLDAQIARVKDAVRLAAEAVAAHTRGAEGQRSSALGDLFRQVSAANPTLSALANVVGPNPELTGAELAARLAAALGDGPYPRTSADPKAEA